MRVRCRISAILGVLALLGSEACAPRPLMCDRPNQCPSQAACVAGRCEVTSLAPRVRDAERRVFEAEAVAYVTRDNVLTSGEARLGNGGMLFLRFAPAIAKEAQLIEAYVLVERIEDDANFTPFTLRASPVASPFGAQTIQWSRFPSIGLSRSAETRVFELSPHIVRIDVLDIVQKWRNGSEAYGIAIESSGKGRGAPFALSAARASFGPRLEVYLR